MPPPEEAPVKKRMPPSPETLREVYIDESSQTKHRYLVLGGLIVDHLAAKDFEAALRAARMPELPQGEMKWTKVSLTKLPAYIRAVDTFFCEFNYPHYLDVHILVVDMQRVKDKLYNKGSREIGFNKEMFQLCMKFWRIYRNSLFHVYPDRRDTPQSPEELRLILNRKSLEKNPNRDWPFRRIHFRDSKELQCLQLIDILIGAVAFKLNGHYDMPDASPAKRALCDHILGRGYVHDVTRDTATAGRFTIWHRQLR